MDNDDIFAVSDKDKTMVRPAVRPHARNTAPETPVGRPTATASPQRNASTTFAIGDGADTIDSIRYAGINRIVAAAAPLLSLINRLRNTPVLQDVNHLRNQLSQEIQTYEASARAKGVDPQNCVIGRYILCATLDEAILNTPWGSSGSWGQRSLLSLFHKETTGGEKVFLVIDRLMREPVVNLELLELAAACLALGLKGKYQLDPMGDHRVEILQTNLLNLIAGARGRTEHTLSPHWETNVPPAPPRRNAFPLWVLAAITGALLVAIYASFNFSLISATTPVISDLERIGKPSIETEIRQ